MKKRHLSRLDNLIDLLGRRADERPDKVVYNFLVDGDSEEVSLTLADLDLSARAIGARVQAMGAISKQVLLLYPPGLEFIKAFFGCLYAGAVAVPAYPPDVMRLQRTMPRFLSIIEDADPILVLTTSPIISVMKQLASSFPALARLEVLATDTISLDTAADAWRHPNITGSALAFLQYTSGSTSEPKGVMLSHHNVLENLAVICQAFQLSPDENYVFWLPFYHDMGLIGGIIGPVYAGGTNTFFSPLQFLQRPMRWLDAISRTKARISGGPNFAYDLCVRKATKTQLDVLDISSWEVAFTGAEPVRAATMKRFSETFAPCGFRPTAFYPTYGLAESTLFITGGVIDELPTTVAVQEAALARNQVVEADALDVAAPKLVSCGHAWLEHEVLIVDPGTMRICSPDQIGEIWVSGNSIAQGYWQQPQATNHFFDAYLADSGKGPYLRTGDLGFMREGELYITGRKKDLIIIDGLNHYPQDIELTVEQSHPALRPGCSAAFGINNSDREQLVVVAEVMRGPRLKMIEQELGEDVTSKVLATGIRTSISLEHSLRSHDIMLLKPGTVPKTSSGKIRRHACKLGYMNGSLEVWEG